MNAPMSKLSELIVCQYSTFPLHLIHTPTLTVINYSISSPEVFIRHLLYCAKSPKKKNPPDFTFSYYVDGLVFICWSFQSSEERSLSRRSYLHRSQVYCPSYTYFQWGFGKWRRGLALACSGLGEGHSLLSLVSCDEPSDLSRCQFLALRSSLI